MRMNQTEFEVRQRVTKEVTEKVTKEVTEKVTNELNEQFIRNLLKLGGFSDQDLAEAVGVSLEEAVRIRKKIEAEGH